MKSAETPVTVARGATAQGRKTPSLNAHSPDAQSIWDRLPRAAAVAIAALSIMALMGAYGGQHLAGLIPCPLCLYQRPPHWIAAGLALLAAVTPLVGMRAAALTGAALALAAGAGIAAFHVGVEQHWWGGLPACSAADAAAAEIKEIFFGQPAVRCDEVSWSLFGVSMAGYNAALSSGLAVLAALGAWCSITASRRSAAGAGPGATPRATGN